MRVAVDRHDSCESPIGQLTRGRDRGAERVWVGTGAARHVMRYGGDGHRKFHTTEIRGSMEGDLKQRHVNTIDTYFGV
jgi:hypothetical protein